MVQSCGKSLAVRFSGHNKFGSCCFYLVFSFHRCDIDKHLVLCRTIINTEWNQQDDFF